MFSFACRLRFYCLLFPLPIAMLAVALFAWVPVIGPAFGQSLGCNRCNGATFQIGPFSLPNPFYTGAPPPAEPAWGNWERRGSGELRPRRRSASLSREKAAGEAPGGSMYVCVRACDGSFFPLPYTGAGGAALQEICQALCPNAEVALYSMPFGGTIDEAVSWRGTRYTAQDYALKFQQTFDTACSCRRTGQGWADALAAAEAKYGHRSHEIVVTPQASLEMSRPKPGPNAKPSGNGAPANVEQPDPGLDANGVDTRLKAATAAVSRETSGIKDEEAEGGAHFGLRQGQVVEEDDPDGGRRAVRILSPMF